MENCFCSVCDENYLSHFATLMCSIAIHATDYKPNIVLISDGLSNANKNAIIDYGNSIGVNLEVVIFDTKLIDALPTSKRFTTATYIKIMLGEAVPSKYNKCIFLDSDTVVLEDVRSLFDRKMATAICAVRDPVSYNPVANKERLQKLNLPLDFHYYNTGVMLINLDEWRSAKLGERSCKYGSEQSDKLTVADQCIMNAANNEYFSELPRKFNYMPDMTFDQSCPVAVLHYAGKAKPWNVMGLAGGHIYWQCRSKTPWPTYNGPQEKYFRRGKLAYFRGLFSYFLKKYMPLMQPDTWSNKCIRNYRNQIKLRQMNISGFN